MKKGKVRKLEERLGCVCMCNKAGVARNIIRGGTKRERRKKREKKQCAHVSTCASADVDAQPVSIKLRVYIYTKMLI